jgi:hypothetical protein
MVRPSGLKAVPMAPEYWREAREAAEPSTGQVPGSVPGLGTSPKPDTPPGVQRRRRIGCKALVLTIPLALIPFGITYSAAGQPSRHLPLWQSLVLAVLIAAIGVPKWRVRAIGFLILALIVFWVLGA